jgi:hypothetical protein
MIEVMDSTYFAIGHLKGSNVNLLDNAMENICF